LFIHPGSISSASRGRCGSHGAIAEHYKVDPAALTEAHAATLDYVVAATAG